MPRKSISVDLKLPSKTHLILPVFKAMKHLGGSGTNAEINSKAVEIAGLTDEQLEVPHPGQGADTEIEYRLHWARTYLKKYGVIENSKRGVWALTPKGTAINDLDPSEVVHDVNRQVKIIEKSGRRREIGKRPRRAREATIERADEANENWQDKLSAVLLNLSPSAFERLVQRLLRESGFIQVTVTGRSGDGGVDGKGIMRLGGLLSFPVIFQAKKWKGSVGAKQIRDFRGDMVGRAEKGLFVTTGSFTPDALREATREGAPPIDLVDGDQLANRLRELGLGISTKLVQQEVVEIDTKWFESI